MTIGVLLGVRPPMLPAIWFASFYAGNIIPSPAEQNLELKADVLTQYFGQFGKRDALRAELQKSLECEPNIQKRHFLG